MRGFVVLAIDGILAATTLGGETWALAETCRFPR
jgi:hypothetical protein